MKKILFLIAVLSAMLFTTTAFAIQGEGTEESPFLITNQEELMLVSDFPDCHFKLVNDIELEGEFVPLCKASDGFKGVFDGNGKTISNLTIMEYSDFVGLFERNYGIIKNLKVITSDDGVENGKSGGSAGVLVGSNIGEISDCRVYGIIKGTYDYNYVGRIGGIAGKSTGIIQRVSFEGYVLGRNANTGGIAGELNCGRISFATVNGYIISDDKRTGGIAGAAVGSPNSFEISNSYVMGAIVGDFTSGIVLNYAQRGKVTNCYSTAVHYASYDMYGILEDTLYGKANNCFYNKIGFTSFVTGDGTPKTTTEMKMKKTYTDAGWDFENVWGIDENINDGYPYLLWEYAETDSSSASTEITFASSTPTSLKFVSTVATEGEPEIATFGTTFIPLWLFETGSSDVATVEYNNAEHNIQNGQTFGATLSNIPEAAKDMVIVGKSFVKDAEGNYTWSAAKSASVNNPTLNTVE